MCENIHRLFSSDVTSIYTNSTLLITTLF